MSQSGLIDIEGSHPQIPTQFDTDSGTAIPIANTLEILGDTVANSTYASPLFTTGSGNTVTANIQAGAAITGSPADKNDAGIVSFDDTMFTVDANGYVQLIGGSTGIDSVTPDDGNVVSADGAGNINYQGETVANGTYVKPLYTTGTPASNLITPNIQATTSLGSAPADFNDAGIASFDSSAFNVSAFGYVQLAGGGSAVEQFTLDDGNTVTANASGNIDYLGQSTPNENGVESYRIAVNQIGFRMASPFTLEDFTFSTSTAGTPRSVTIAHTDNTNTSSSAKVIISTGGASGGNPEVNYNISGVIDYTMGIDNATATDPFVLTDASTIASGNKLITWFPTTNNYRFGYGLNSTNNELVIRNTGTTDAGAKLTASVGVSSTGDPFVVTQIESTRSYCWGIDNSDSDTLKINTTAASNVTPSGGTNLYYMTTSGDAGYSTGTGYLQIQKGTTAQRPGSPANGMIRYNTDLNTYEGYQSSGATWLDLAGGGGSSPLTTKGDIYTYDTGDARLAIGTDGQTLIADSAQSTGNKWGVLQEVGGGTAQSTYTTGDLLYASASNTLSKLAVGTIPGDQLIVNDSGIVQWNTDVIVLNDDFIFDLDQSSTNSNGSWEAIRTATGDVTNIAGTAAHPGLIELSVAATSDDANISRGQPTTGEIVLGGGYIRYDFLIKFDTLADVTDDYIAFIGLGNWTAFTSGVDYAGFLYDRSTSTNWLPQTSASSTTTTASGGSSVAVDTNWTHLSCIINAGGTQVDFYVDGTAAGSCTTNIPSTAITPQLQLTKTAGSNTRNLIVDVFRFYNKLTTARWV